MRLQYRNTLLDIEVHIGIALELSARALELAKSFLVSLNLICEISLVESAAFKVFQRAVLDFSVLVPSSLTLFWRESALTDSSLASWSPLIVSA